MECFCHAFSDLSDNAIEVLPTEIGNLANLVGLTLHKNKILEVPTEFAALTKLQALHLADNLLTALPDLTALTKLEYFHT